MEDLVESLTRGNVAEVKVLLASVALALGVYQLAVIAVGYGKLRLPFLAAPPAFAAHRAVGDTIALLLLCTGVMCVSVDGFEDDEAVHAVAGTALLSVLAFKVSVVRRDFGLGRFLPLLGISVFLLLCVTWATSAGGFLA
jgi:ABC-type phosphate transport system permease subunit